MWINRGRSARSEPRARGWTIVDRSATNRLRIQQPAIISLRGRGRGIVVRELHSFKLLAWAAGAASTTRATAATPTLLAPTTTRTTTTTTTTRTTATTCTTPTSPPPPSANATTTTSAAAAGAYCICDLHQALCHKLHNACWDVLMALSHRLAIVLLVHITAT